ncbi:MAG: hypothetical protein ACMZ66_01625 [Thalassospira sp.]|uniref:hypothetical protein n=1 Tax=Thalassospira sp. TaxID=1912094 RepID=UPI003A8862BF
MSIGANWRQISPGSVPGTAGDVAGNKFAQSNAADQLSENAEGRTFSEYMFGEDGFEFTDFLDVINPLQHIPGVGMIYRSLTGDELGNGARVVGGGLFGGVFGLAGAAIDAVVDAVTGDDTGSHIMAFVEDGFGGGTPDDGTAVADASGSAAGAATVAANDGSYQGELVLPWMTTDSASSAYAASQAEQATIVQAAPTAPVDQAIPASAAAPSSNGFTGVKPSDLNVPWGQATHVAASNVSPQLQAQMQAHAVTTEVAEAGPEPDPAELSVAMAAAGTANPAAPATTMTKTIASNSDTGSPIKRASFSSDAGNTVWARAASSGRVSRQENTFAISAEMAAHETRYAKRNLVKEERQSVIDENIMSDSGGPLSAAEMAARFNAALGREKAQTMAADAVSGTNAVADQGRLSAREENQSAGVTHNASVEASGAEEEAVHPLMQRASNHMGGDEPVGAWFSQTMMDGLKKYQAMQKQSQPSGNSI